jgi:hypothetical protein
MSVHFYFLDALNAQRARVRGGSGGMNDQSTSLTRLRRASGVFLFIALSGFIPLLVRYGVILQWILLLHIVVGVLAAIPLTAIFLKHLRESNRDVPTPWWSPDSGPDLGGWLWASAVCGGPDVGYMLGPRANSCQPASGYRREPALDRVSVGRVSSPKNTEKRQVNRELAKAIVLATGPFRSPGGLISSTPLLGDSHQGVRNG